jgi:cyclopropane fatty-acyl-phospholipid synthase-like methyltransferase
VQDFKDLSTARAWDADTLSGNPTRAEQLDILLTVLQSEVQPGSAIVDLGSGSGQVEELLLDRLPDARVVGVDASRAMLNLARDRLARHEARYRAVEHDLTRLPGLRLPPGRYGAAISVQTLHNLSDEHKRSAFRWVWDALEPGGLFLLLDRIAVDTPSLFHVYRCVWRRLERFHSARLSEGETYEEHTSGVSARGDRPANLVQHLLWLSDAGFETACLHLHAHRALIVGRKP